VRSWLVKVLYNTFIDQQRRASRSPLRLLRLNYNEESHDILESVPTEQSGPEENSMQSQRRTRLLRAINSLNKNQRYVCLLHDVEGYTFSELEEILDTPIGTLKSRLHRARENLRKLLKNETF
jgi:RNA polymerase sigma-70 factor (ECF subfamily)